MIDTSKLKLIFFINKAFISDQILQEYYFIIFEKKKKSFYSIY